MSLTSYMNWTDIAVVVILLFFAIDGLLKGFILSIIRAAGFFISIYAAKILAPVFSGYICADSNIYMGVNEYLGDKIISNSSIVTVFSVFGLDKSKLNSELTSLFITIAVYLIIFLIFKLGLSLLAGLLNVTAKLPVIKQFNKVGGFIFGALKGLLILYIVFAVLVLLTPVLPPDNGLIPSINNSLLACNFYNSNFIIQWLSVFIH